MGYSNTATTGAEIHHSRTVVLEWRCVSCCIISRFIEEICIYAISEPSRPCAGGAVRAGHEHRRRGSGTRTTPASRLENGETAPGSTHAKRVSTLPSERASRVHGDQGR